MGNIRPVSVKSVNARRDCHRKPIINTQTKAKVKIQHATTSTHEYKKLYSVIRSNPPLSIIHHQKHTKYSKYSPSIHPSASSHTRVQWSTATYTNLAGRPGGYRELSRALAGSVRHTIWSFSAHSGECLVPEVGRWWLWPCQRPRYVSKFWS